MGITRGRCLRRRGRSGKIYHRGGESTESEESEEEEIEKTEGRCDCELRRPSFFDAYLPFFGGFAVFFVFFAMPGSCGFSQAAAMTQTPMRLLVYGW
jgi:hypothetical protein